MPVFILFVFAVLSTVMFLLAAYINKRDVSSTRAGQPDVMAMMGAVIFGCAGVAFLVMFMVKLVQLTFVLQ